VVQQYAVEIKVYFNEARLAQPRRYFQIAPTTGAERAAVAS